MQKKWENDSRTIWRAINWDGSIDETTPDAEFKLHFDKLLDPGEVECTNIPVVSDCPYILNLDDGITENEVIAAARTCKERNCKESTNYIGITSAMSSCLSMVWITHRMREDWQL